MGKISENDAKIAALRTEVRKLREQLSGLPGDADLLVMIDRAEREIRQMQQENEDVRRSFSPPKPPELGRGGRSLGR